jgi:hypothetical protein
MHHDPNIAEFQRVYEKEFGTDLSPIEAQFMVERLVRLYNIVAQPFPHDDTT